MTKLIKQLIASVSLLAIVAVSSPLSVLAEWGPNIEPHASGITHDDYPEGLTISSFNNYTDNENYYSVFPDERNFSQAVTTDLLSSGDELTVTAGQYAKMIVYVNNNGNESQVASNTRVRAQGFYENGYGNFVTEPFDSAGSAQVFHYISSPDATPGEIYDDVKFFSGEAAGEYVRLRLYPAQNIVRFRPVIGGFNIYPPVAEQSQLFSSEGILVGDPDSYYVDDPVNPRYEYSNDPEVVKFRGAASRDDILANNFRSMRVNYWVLVQKVRTDLALTKTASKSEIGLNESVEIDIDFVSNIIPDDTESKDVVITDSYDASIFSLDSIAMTAEGECVDDNGQITCTLANDLFPSEGGSINYTLVADKGTAGVMNEEANISSTMPDVDESNNNDAAQVTVEGSAPAFEDPGFTVTPASVIAGKIKEFEFRINAINGTTYRIDKKLTSGELEPFIEENNLDENSDILDKAFLAFNEDTTLVATVSNNFGEVSQEFTIQVDEEVVFETNGFTVSPAEVDLGDQFTELTFFIKTENGETAKIERKLSDGSLELLIEEWVLQDGDGDGDNDAVLTLTGDTTFVATVSNAASSATAEFTVVVNDQNSDASLSDLAVDGSTIASFDPATLNYTVNLPFTTTEVPTVSATANDANASVVVTQASDVNGAATVVVTAEDGTQSTYTVDFVTEDSVCLAFSATPTEIESGVATQFDFTVDAPEIISGTVKRVENGNNSEFASFGPTALTFSETGSFTDNFTFVAETYYDDDNNGIVDRLSVCPETYEVTIGDLSAPTIASAEVLEADPIKVQIAFSEDITFVNENEGGFLVKQNGSELPILNLESVDSQTLNLILLVPIIPGATVTLDYDPTQGEVLDLAGNELAEQADFPVVNQDIVNSCEGFTASPTAIESGLETEFTFTLDAPGAISGTIIRDTGLEQFEFKGINPLNVEDSKRGIFTESFTFIAEASFDTDNDGIIDLTDQCPGSYEVSVSDTTMPQLLTAAVSEEANRIKLEFDEEITFNGNDSGGFTVFVDGNEVAIDNLASFTAETLDLILVNAIAPGATVTLNYDPQVGEVADVAGNELLELINFPVTNELPTDVCLGFTASPTTIESGLETEFTFSIDAPEAISGVVLRDLSGQESVLTGANPDGTSENLTTNFTQEFTFLAKALFDTDNDGVGDVYKNCPETYPVTIQNTLPPVVTNAEVALADPKQIYIDLNEPITITSADQAGFTIKADGQEITITEVQALNDQFIILILERDIQAGEVVTLDYDPALGEVVDAADNELEALTDYPVTNDLELTARCDDFTVTPVAVIDSQTTTFNFSVEATAANWARVFARPQGSTDPGNLVTAIALDGTTADGDDNENQSLNVDTEYYAIVEDGSGNTDQCVPQAVTVGEAVIDLEVTKEPATQSINKGETASFTVTVTNNGSIAANNVELVDYYNNQVFSNISNTLPSNCFNVLDGNGSHIECLIPTLEPGSDNAFSFSYTASTQNAQLGSVNDPAKVWLEPGKVDENNADNYDTAEVRIFIDPTPGDLVVNELNWQSTRSGDDQWLELRNTTDFWIDLSAFELTHLVGGVESVMLNIPSNEAVGPLEHYLIAKKDASAADSALANTPDLVDPAVTVASSDLQIGLYDNAGVKLDTAGSGSGLPFAGSVATSMSRNWNAGDGTNPNNWFSASETTGFDGGATDRGTPGKGNFINLVASSTAGSGDQVRVTNVFGEVINIFNSFKSTSVTGTTLAAGDTDNDGSSEIIIGKNFSAADVIQTNHLGERYVRPSNGKDFIQAATSSKGVNVAVCDLDGDGVKGEIVTGLKSNASGTQLNLIRAFTKDGEIIKFTRNGTTFHQFKPFSSPADEVMVACGDVNGDGRDEILASKSEGANQVVVIDSLTARRITFFTVDRSGPDTGINIAAGDVDGDGVDEIIAGKRGGRMLFIHKMDSTLVNSFEAFGQGDGVNVSTLDVDNDGIAEILIGKMSGSNHVVLAEPNGTRIRFFRGGADGGDNARVAGAEMILE
jgi:uncharacterized repeat protein (TIGR01451 family)